ncbi:MAG: hypothetical protein ACD_79C00933G0002 [uncultured bacterium]|nr:MAG: hypothetical protein ACD_79C00933G0002 [uncultured bacterium]
MDIEAIFEKIISNLGKHGFPAKKVSFPKQSIENFVKKHDYDLTDVLDELHLNKDIYYKINDNQIIFSKTEFNEEKETKEDIDLSKLKNMDPSILKQQAESMMKNMSPEELNEIQRKFENLSSEEKQKIFEMAKNMGLS